MSVERPQRRARRQALKELEASIEALKVHDLSIPQLEQLDIWVQEMALNASSRDKPYFFLPRSNFSLPPVECVQNLTECLGDEDTSLKRPVDRAYQVQANWSSYCRSYISRLEGWPWWSGDPADHRTYKHVYQYDQPEFGAFNLMDIRGSSFPHSKAAIYNNMEGVHHKLLRGELLILLRMMLGRLKKRPLLEHMIAPVFMVSFMGKRARAIEAYYDGQHLILRRTAFYNFPEQTSPAFKELGEWYCGNPTGNTH
ncbi:hypothetical protein BP00DRAFT_424123 [Aspergillus indologenus CBS 114.80]|uniref:Uncharacterized protein n=1 Tax=Aspergillus indologenus CBS 114.80 TaxID=1450541 RepID=A0A2V5IB33_9EURO|nr:hypothetical protein BP00DRAFT_424123 [Aspergillus indologenus CBS 114.80]